MVAVLAFLMLVAAVGTALYYTLQPRDDGGDTPEDAISGDETPFSLSRSIILFGAARNDQACKDQRYELKRILGALVAKKLRVVEVYGTDTPFENGKPRDFLDNHLMRKMLSAEHGYHLILVGEGNRTYFHSSVPIAAEALFHILDLQDMLPEPADAAQREDDEVQLLSRAEETGTAPADSGEQEQPARNSEVPRAAAHSSVETVPSSIAWTTPAAQAAPAAFAGPPQPSVSTATIGRMQANGSGPGHSFRDADQGAGCAASGAPPQSDVVFQPVEEPRHVGIVSSPSPQLADPVSVDIADPTAPEEPLARDNWFSLPRETAGFRPLGVSSITELGSRRAPETVAEAIKRRLGTGRAP